MRLDELAKLESAFLANIQRRREVLHEHLAALDKDEAEGKEAFRILKQKASQGGEESILKAMQNPFQTGSRSPSSRLRTRAATRSTAAPSLPGSASGCCSV